jgi:hypothetical protein
VGIYKTLVFPFFEVKMSYRSCKLEVSKLLDSIFLLNGHLACKKDRTKKFCVDFYLEL